MQKTIKRQPVQQMTSPQNSSPNYNSRLKAFRHWLEIRGFDGALISRKENIYYLTGVKQIHPTNREALLFLSKNKALLYHSAFITPKPHDLYQTLTMTSAGLLQDRLKSFFIQTKSIVIEADNLTVSEHDRFQTLLTGIKINAWLSPLEDSRAIKDPHELRRIKHAAGITSDTMAWIINYLKRNQGRNLTEIEIARKIDQRLEKLGADSAAFPTIVAVGSNSASPHHQPTTRTINKNSVVLLDFGAKYRSYCADMTRTIFLGNKPETFVKIERVVKRAYQHATRCLSNPHPKASSLDTAARASITKAGFGKEFIHTTGHSLGLDIHEPPSLNSTNEQEIKPNMVITIEPGIYVPNTFGYRFENTLAIQENGFQELTI
jgi:Xaa-Pro aminopeptidase